MPDSTRLVERAVLLATMRGFAGPGGCLLFVAGEAGIGKTELVNRFCAGLPAGTAVYRGSCDALATPRALGPLLDIARIRPRGLGRLLAGGQDRHALFTAFLDLLATGPSVTVVEDAHWADEATLDLLLFVARRIGELPAMVIVTYRSEEVDRDHPLRRVLGDLATVRSVRRLTVPPLTEAAVAALAEQAGRDGAQLHAVTGGNPFFVTEALGAPADDVPATVRDAVLARASRLTGAARAVLDLVSLVPDRVEVALLEAIARESFEVGSAGLDDALRSGMLVLDVPATVGFRHELARRAVEADVPAAHAAGLHGRILAFLAAADGVDPARLSFHATPQATPRRCCGTHRSPAELAVRARRAPGGRRALRAGVEPRRATARRPSWRSCGSVAPTRASAAPGRTRPPGVRANWSRHSKRRRGPSSCGRPRATSNGRPWPRPAGPTSSAARAAAPKHTTRPAPPSRCWRRSRRDPGRPWPTWPSPA